VSEPRRTARVLIGSAPREIGEWQAQRPDRGAALKREIDKRARSIASYVEAIADGYSKELGGKLRALQAEQAIAVAELANIAAAAPVLPSPMALRERIRSLGDLSGALPVEEARELLRGVTGDIECELEADGSFRLSGALNFAAMLNAPDLAIGGVRHSLVAGAGFEPTTFGL
jgi:hypothetical protein